MRIDLYLVQNGSFSTRTKALAAIKSGGVSVNGKTVKASYSVAEGDEIVVNAVQKYVGRGGYKLEAALQKFGISLEGKTVIDIGASTGGFTDCALQNGAKKVYAVDVGHGQLDETLAKNSKVVNLEGTDIRALSGILPCDVATIDVSFISLENVLPYVKPHITQAADIVCLVKPQFEIGKKRLKNGVVKDEKDFIYVLEKVMALAQNENLGVLDIDMSPIRGGEGNIEFLFLLRQNVSSKPFDIKKIVKQAKGAK